jgi:hypothetical protein
MTEDRVKKELKGLKPFVLMQVFIIGILWLADTFFYFFEQNIFNTYVTNVLSLGDLYVKV